MLLPEDSEACNSLILSDKEERILEVVRDMTYVTALDIKHLLYPERSLTTMQRDLAKLSDSQDPHGRLLDRFPLPATTRGMKQFVYVLSTKGREVMGVEGYYRPYKQKALSYSHIRHHLCLTRFVCSARVWCHADPHVRLADIRLCYELAKELAKAETTTQGTPSPAPVVPDGYLNFELLQKENGSHLSYVPTWLEIDRGTEYRNRFQNHVEDRIEYIRSDKYAKFFNENAVRIAYATISTRDEDRQSRLAAMRHWTLEVLTDLKLEKWKTVFYFTSLAYEDLYNLNHFTEPVWQTPADDTKRHLLEKSPAQTSLPKGSEGATS